MRFKLKKTYANLWAFYSKHYEKTTNDQDTLMFMKTYKENYWRTLLLLKNIFIFLKKNYLLCFKEFNSILVGKEFKKVKGLGTFLASAKGRTCSK